MADVLLFHSVLGLRPVELDLAEQWRGAGHNVTTPDLFEGRTAEAYDEGFAILEQTGLLNVEERALEAAGQCPDNLVLAGVSNGRGGGGACLGDEAERERCPVFGWSCTLARRGCRYTCSIACGPT